MTYLQAFLVFLMVLSPVLLPAVISLFHALVALAARVVRRAEAGRPPTSAGHCRHTGLTTAVTSSSREKL